MRITVLSLRQKRQDPFSALVNEYQQKIKKWPIDQVEILHKGSPDRINTSEKLIGALPKDSYIVLLEEQGKEYTSPQFAKFLDARMLEAEKHITFVIGGPEGADPQLKKRADLLLSFGKATWPHKMVQLMLTEQLYRAQQILDNHPYHKE